MSAEYYYAGHTDEDLVRAQSRAEALLFTDSSPLTYLNEIAKELHSSTSGRVELLRMKRVAEFICGPGELAVDSDITSFMYGELAAENLLTQLTDTPHTAGTYAHEFLKYRMEDDRTADRFAFTEEDLVEYQVSLEESFTLSQIRALHQEAASSIRAELTGEFAALPSTYENHLETLLDSLNWDTVSTHHFIMGYRIVMKEFHQPSKIEDQDIVLEMTNEYATNSLQVPVSTESDSPIPNAAELHTLLHDIKEINLEPIGHIREMILEHFNRYITGFGGVTDMADATMTLGVRAYQEHILQAHNRNHELLSNADIIFAQGNHAVCLQYEDGTEWLALDSRAQLFGTFETLAVLEAPSQKTMWQKVSHSNVVTPAITLVNASIILNGEPLFEEPLTLSLPLLYSTVSLQRLADSQFEDTLDS